MNPQKIRPQAHLHPQYACNVISGYHKRVDGDHIRDQITAYLSLHYQEMPLHLASTLIHGNQFTVCEAILSSTMDPAGLAVGITSLAFDLFDNSVRRKFLSLLLSLCFRPLTDVKSSSSFLL